MLRPSTTLLLVPLLALGACAAPRTQLGTVSQDQVILEQARQQEFVLESRLRQEFRVQNVTNPLLVAAVPLCADNVRPISGYFAGNAYSWQKDYFKAAERIGYSDTLIIMNVTPGLPGDNAGLKRGDRILAVNGVPIAPGPRAVNALESKLPSGKERSPKAYTLTFRRGGDTSTVRIATAMACTYNAEVIDSTDVQALATGRSIKIYVGMLRFVSDDDELAAVVGHELAHNAMRHRDAKIKNSMVGALLGAIVDVAAATQGVNTQGDFTKQGAALGSMVFSQDFEREADYVGLYILALAGRPLEVAPTLWRRMATVEARNIKFASTHPTTAERFVRLENWRGEIDRKIALGLPLAPEMKDGKTPFPGSFGSVPTRTALNPKAARSSATSIAAIKASPRKTHQALAESGEPRKLETLGTAKSGPDANPAILSSTRSEPPVRSQPQVSPKPLARGNVSSMVAARAVIGVPSSDSDRVAAIESFAEANAFMGSHQWTKAEESFRKTVVFDGSVAKYHAGLGSVLMLLGKWKDAEAEYIAALMLDLDNPVYTRMIKEARSKR